MSSEMGDHRVVGGAIPIIGAGSIVQTNPRIQRTPKEGTLFHLKIKLGKTKECVEKENRVSLPVGRWKRSPQGKTHVSSTWSKKGVRPDATQPIQDRIAYVCPTGSKSEGGCESSKTVPASHRTPVHSTARARGDVPSEFKLFQRSGEHGVKGAKGCQWGEKKP